MKDENQDYDAPLRHVIRGEDSLIFNVANSKIVHQPAEYYAALHARIVACYNACAGIPSEALERAAFKTYETTTGVSVEVGQEPVRVYSLESECKNPHSGVIQAIANREIKAGQMLATKDISAFKLQLKQEEMPPSIKEAHDKVMNRINRTPTMTECPKCNGRAYRELMIPLTISPKWDEEALREHTVEITYRCSCGYQGVPYEVMIEAAEREKAARAANTDTEEEDGNQD